MALGRKIIHDLEDAAQSMIDFVLKAENHHRLIELIADVSEEYKKPFDSYVWSPLYRIFGWRTRVSAVNDLKISAQDEHNTGRLLLISLVNFMQAGSWKETSANTNLMFALLARLPQYQLTDPNPRLSLTLAELKEMHLVFEARAHSIIYPVKADLTQTAAVRAEVESLPKRNIRELGKHLPDNSDYRKKELKKEWLPANKTVKTNFRDIMATLETLYGSRQDNLPATKSGVTAKRVVTPVSAETIAGHEIPAAPPAPPVMLSDAALAVTEKVVQWRQEKYVAQPAKLKITDEMKVMAMSMFAAKSTIQAPPRANVEDLSTTMSL